ncbi:MAG: hypothetical protein ACQEXJ_20780 [Myxococcota bacterium]
MLRGRRLELIPAVAPELERLQQAGSRCLRHARPTRPVVDAVSRQAVRLRLSQNQRAGPVGAHAEMKCGSV